MGDLQQTTEIGIQTYTVCNDSDGTISAKLYPEWAHQILGVFLIFVVVFGTIFNSIGLYVFGTSKQLQTPTNIFVIGLLVCDLCMAVLGVPLSAANALHGSWFSGHTWCVWEGFIVYFFGLSALYILTAISVDRYIILVQPLRSKIITKRVALSAVIACFIGGLFWAFLPLLGWSSYGVEAAEVFCGLNYRDRSLSNTTYIIAIFIFCFASPIFIMAFCYIFVYLTIRHISRTNVWDENSQIARNNLRLQKKMLKSIVLMCGCFLLCWTPYAILAFWQSFGDADSIPAALTALPAVMAKSELIWNPIIYVATNKQFRNAFYAIIPCRRLSGRLVQLDQTLEAVSRKPGGSESMTVVSRVVPVSFDVRHANTNPVAVAPEETDLHV